MQFQQFINIFPTDHNFNTDGKFTIIEKLQNTKLSKKSITEILKKRDSFCIKKLETLRLKGFQYDLVFVQSKIETQPAITRSKLTIETLEQGVKYVQS